MALGEPAPTLRDRKNTSESCHGTSAELDA
jgi:hypothetical protein